MGRVLIVSNLINEYIYINVSMHAYLCIYTAKIDFALTYETLGATTRMATVA